MSTRTKRLIIIPLALLMAGAIAIVATQSGSGAKAHTGPALATRAPMAETHRAHARPKRAPRHRARPVRTMRLPARAAVSSSQAPAAQGPASPQPNRPVQPPTPPVRHAAPPKPPAPVMSQPAIPQHNGGDMDADNSGGPNDGDGAQ